MDTKHSSNISDQKLFNEKSSTKSDVSRPNSLNTNSPNPSAFQAHHPSSTPTAFCSLDSSYLSRDLPCKSKNSFTYPDLERRSSPESFSSKKTSSSLFQLTRGIGFQAAVMFPIRDREIVVEQPEKMELGPPTPKARRRRRIILIESIILVLAITTLGISSAYGVHLQSLPSLSYSNNSSTPYYVPPRLGSSLTVPQDANSLIVWYVATMPVLSIVMCWFGLMLAVRRLITRNYCIGVSVVFVMGWVGQMGWWGGCEWVSSTGSRGEYFLVGWVWEIELMRGSLSAIEDSR
jgi:hypothetical protein